MDLNAANKKLNGRPRPAKTLDEEMKTEFPELVPEHAQDEALAVVDIAPPTISMTLAEIKRTVAPYATQLQEMVNAVTSATVDSPESEAKMVESVGIIKKSGKRLEDLRKRIISETDQFTRGTNAIFKQFSTLVDEANRAGTRAIQAYTIWKRLEEEKARRAAEEAQRLAQKKLDEEAKKLGIKAPDVPVPIVERNDGPIRTQAGTAYTKKVWKWVVEKKEDIPPDYFLLDEARIGWEVRAGVRSIPGIRIFEDEETQIRTK